MRAGTEQGTRSVPEKQRLEIGSAMRHEERGRVGRVRPRMQNYCVTFSRQILGVPFPVASFLVRHARTPERAQRAAELRLMRSRGLPDWRLCADALEIR